MKAHRFTFHLAAASMLAMAVGSFAGACSSNSNGGNPAPSGDDGGDATSSSSSGAGSSSGTGSSSGSSSGAGSSSGSSSGGLPDTGACMSDASTCNSCYTAQQAMQDPLNACSPYTANCTPFSNKTRVPGWPNVPQVP